MKPSHLLAMRAAYRVAFSSAIVACGGGVVSTSSDVPSDAPASPATSTPPAAVLPDPPPAPAPPPPPAEVVDASVDAVVPNACKSAASEEVCCLALERAERAVREDAGAWPELASADAIACCDVTLTAARADGGTAGATWEDTWACCTAVPNAFSKYPESCSAWGPPVPPAIAWRPRYQPSAFAAVA
jgi:hypothetical protein